MGGVRNGRSGRSTVPPIFPKKHKYSAKKTEIDGIVFASKREAARYSELKLLQKGGVIANLRLQVPYAFVVTVGAEGHTIESTQVYVADFVYCEQGELVVEDVKGYKTKEYLKKKKWMWYLYGIRIKET